MAKANVDFFISGPLGQEVALSQEISEVLPFCLDKDAQYFVSDLKLEILKGGVLVSLPVGVGLQLNYWLKTANRVLIRLGSFEAKSWPRMQDRLKEFFQGNSTHLPVQLKDSGIQVDSMTCKLNNEKFLREKIFECFKLNAAKGPFFLRGENDQWTVSWDTTGEHLHKRGERTWVGEAPLRETWAAFTIRELIKNRGRSSLSQVCLIDPMAGSGVFLSEALAVYSPSISRSYRFQNEKICPALLKSTNFWSNYSKDQLSNLKWHSLVAIDKETEIISKLNQDSIVSFKKNFTEVVDLNLPNAVEKWVVTNPPYGHRLKDTSWTQGFANWIQAIKASRLALWLPIDFDLASIQSLGKPQPTLKVRNGGLPCQILFYEF